MAHATFRNSIQVFTKEGTEMKDGNQRPTQQVRTEEAAIRIVKWAYICVLAMLAVGAICMVFTPVFEQISESIGLVTQSFRYARGGDVKSIAVLCIVIIGIVGLMKVIKK
jgi:hypothetical protein